MVKLKLQKIDKYMENFRVCLIHTDLLENFFKTRDVLKIPNSDEVKYLL